MTDERMIEPVDERQQVAAYYFWLQNGKRPNDPKTDLWWTEGGLFLVTLAEEATGGGRDEP